MEDKSCIHSEATMKAKSNSIVTLDNYGYIYFTLKHNGVVKKHCIGKMSNDYVIKHDKG